MNKEVKYSSIIIIVIALLFLGYVYFTNLKNDSKPSLGTINNIVLDQNKEVNLEVKNIDFENNIINLKLENKKDKPIIYGDYYNIQRFYNNEWYNLNIFLSFNEIGYELKEKEAVDISINYNATYGSLEKGNYRLIKNYNEKNNEVTTNPVYSYEDAKYIAVEFEIK